MHGPKWSNWALNKADLIIACGSRFDDRVTGQAVGVRAGRGRRPPRHRRGRDREAARADVPVVGPLKQVLRDLTVEVRKLREDGKAGLREAWLAQIADWREQFPLRYREGRRLR